LGAVFWVALIIAMPIVGMHLKLVNVAAATLLGVLVGMVFGYMTLAISAVYNRKAIAVIITVYVAIQSYFLNTLGDSLKELHTAQKFSPFYYASHGNPLIDGLAAKDTIVLAAICIVFVAIAAVGFTRRDIRS
jgi:ABC-2 type transport system permease protein